MYKESELLAKKLPELKEIGLSLSIPKANYLRKPELIEKIMASGKESGSSVKPTEQAQNGEQQEHQAKKMRPRKNDEPKDKKESGHQDKSEERDNKPQHRKEAPRRNQGDKSAAHNNDRQNKDQNEVRRNIMTIANSTTVIKTITNVLTTLEIVSMNLKALL